MSSPVLERTSVFPTSRVSAARQPITVAHVVRSLTTGGQELLIARLAERMDRTRFRPVVISILESGWLAEKLQSQGITVHSLNHPEGFSPGLVLKLAGVLRHDGVGIVHCHNRTPLFYGGLASLLVPRCRLMVTRHGNSSWSDSSTAPVLRWLLRRAGAIVPVSAEIERSLRDGGWADKKPMEVISNGVDTEQFRPEPGEALRARLGFRPEDRVVGTVARLSCEKDQATLLRAFARVRERLAEARLLLVGDGPSRSDLEALARELRITDFTLFAGEQKETAPFYHAMDVFTLPSLREGTSLTLLEAMACARPVVASAVGGTPDVVRDGVSGLLTPPSQPTALAEALLDVLLRSPEEQQAMGSAGRKIVSQRFSLDSMVERYQTIYERLRPPQPPEVRGELRAHNQLRTHPASLYEAPPEIRGAGGASLNNPTENKESCHV